MLKRIIFDLDNTLIMWKDEYISALKNVLDEMNIDYTEELLYKIDTTIVEYEKYHNKYSKKEFINFVNKSCKCNLPIEFMDKLIIEQGKCYEDDNNLKDTIKYLSTKYDLVVLSNWFTETQKLRLNKAGILSYFTFVSGGDERALKPNLDAFSKVLENYKPKECLMVGDNLESDIKPALKLGMNAIWVTKEKSSTYETIESIHELKNIL